MTAPPKTPMRPLSDHPSEDHVTSRSDVAEEAQGNNDVPVPTNTPCGDMDNAIPVSPFEKRKCPSYYSLPKCVLPPRKDMVVVEKFVAGTIDSEIEVSPEKEAKRRQTYERMTQSFRENTDPDMVHKFLLALRTAGNGSTLHQLSGNPAKHVELLRVLHQLNPFQPNPPKKTSDKNPEEPPKPTDMTLYVNFSISDAHFHLILALVSANPVFLVPSMTNLWNMLAGLATERLAMSVKAARIQRIHATLAAMTVLCPKGKTEIYAIITNHFPFQNRPARELIWCYHQCLEIAEFMPSIRPQVLRFIIDGCLKMDVDIKVHLGGVVKLDKKELDDFGGAFSWEDLESSIQSSSRQRTEAKDATSVYELIDKLDCLLLLTFQYLKDKGTENLNALRILFECCLSAFESSILITHRSKYVQFIMFYMCGLESQLLATNTNYQLSQQHATLNRDLAARFIRITFDPYRSTMVRQSAACYLASFVSRAKFVEADTVSESVCALLRWADAYIAALQANTLSAADARAQCELHSLFYTITQSAFYIMCFRGTEVMELYQSVTEMKQNGIESVPEHLRDLPLQDIDIGPMRWKHVCGHPLQPLLFCLETVRVEFLQFALTFGLLDADMVTRLSGESPVALPTASASANRPKSGVDSNPGNGSNPLKSFFPFDPYLLKNSFPFIQPYYRYWGGPGDAGRSSVVEVTVPPASDDEDPMDEETEEHEVSSTDSDEDDEEKSLHAANGIAASSSQVAHHGDIVYPSEMQKRNRSHSIESAGSW